MSWTAQRQSRARGSYYTLLSKEPRRSVTIGYIDTDKDPGPAAIAARLRKLDPEARLADHVIGDLVRAASDDEARQLARMHRHLDPARMHVGPAEPAKPVTPIKPEVIGPTKDQTGPGAMTLREYVETVWIPVRRLQPATWRNEEWWWCKRLIPALGHHRLIDLDAQKWSQFLGSLTVGGRSKALCQTAYRCAIRHAAEVLCWIPSVHKFAKIVGSTKRTRAEPEPLSAAEVEVLLDACADPQLRCMVGLQIGQGLRPAEVLRVRWEDVDFVHRTLTVRGTKNAMAASTVPLTPLSLRELTRWHQLAGEPAEGHVFSRPAIWGGGPYTAYPRTAFQTAARRSGLNAGRVRHLFPYLARHSFATIAAESGIDRAFTKDMMRHSRASTVLDEAYIRVSKSATARAFSGFGVGTK